MNQETVGQQRSRETIELASTQIVSLLQDLVDLKRTEIELKREELELLKNITK